MSSFLQQKEEHSHMMNRLTTASPHSTPSPTRFTGHVVIEAPTDPDQFLALDEELIALANTYEADCAIGRQAQSDIQYFVASPRENRDNDQFVRLANKFETRAHAGSTEEQPAS
jgi:hypothetical protein